MFAKRFKIGGDAFNHPEIRQLADPLRRRLGFLKQLVNGFMIERGDRLSQLDPISSSAKKCASRLSSK